MRNRILVAALVGLIVIPLTSHAGSESQTVRYVAGDGLVLERSLPNPLGALDEPIGIGGFSFNSRPGKVPVQLKIVDDVSGKAGIGLSICGPSCEPLIHVCTGTNGKVDLTDWFQEGDYMTVWVAAYETGNVNPQACDNNAFTGTLTATWD